MWTLSHLAAPPHSAAASPYPGGEFSHFFCAQHFVSAGLLWLRPHTTGGCAVRMLRQQWNNRLQYKQVTSVINENLCCLSTKCVTRSLLILNYIVAVVFNLTFIRKASFVIVYQTNLSSNFYYTLYSVLDFGVCLCTHKISYFVKSQCIMLSSMRTDYVWPILETR